MIIRRRHTANFTTIGNELLNDDRLEADELGIMAFLRSRPPDWEVRRPALARRFRVGRDSIKRILFNCIRCGWVVARKTRLSNGTFHTLYEVLDEPGPELSPEQVKAALSLVSSEAGDADEAESEGADHVLETGDPDTGQPGAASQLRQTRPGPIEDSLKTDSTKTESPNAARAFSGVREAWPRDHILSLVACEAAHANLVEADKEAAFRGVEPYLSDCRAQNRKVCDLATYYRERRWERFAVKATAGQLAAVYPVTPQAHRWREYLERLGDAVELERFDIMMKLGRCYTAKSEWPPPLPPKAA